MISEGQNIKRSGSKTKIAPLNAPGRTADIVAEIATNVFPKLIMLAVFGAVAYVIYGKIVNRFKPKGEISSYPNANITMGQAKDRAATILESIPLFGSPDLETVARQIAGLNYNGWVRLYNAFGKHTGEWFGGDLDLVSWLRQQFDAEDFEVLGGLQNHAFF